MRVQNIENDSLNYIYDRGQSLSFKVKHMILQAFKHTEKNFMKGLRKMGSENFKARLLDHIIPSVYKKAAKQPVDNNKVVFIEVRFPYISNSFEVMFDELTNNYDYTIHTHFLRNNQCIRSEYTQRCINAVEDIATAKYVFLNESSNVIASVPLRKETKIIQLWHGCGAFKKFGLSTADLIFGENRRQQLRHPFHKNYSLVTVSSPEVIWAYKEAMNIDEQSDIVQATGSSRTDIFYDEAFLKSCRDKLYEVMPQAQGKKVILYAPTFRGRVAKAKTPNMLNIKMFYDNLGDDYVLLFKHHPLVKNPPLIPEEYKDFAVNMGDSMAIEELLSVTDICISDYSSLVFEYSLFEKPLIFFAYDLDEYFDWRGFYYDYYELAPGPIVKTNFEMIDYIKNIDTRFDKKAIQDFRYKFMRSCDGKATQRILETMFDDLESHKKQNNGFEYFHTVCTDEGPLNPYYQVVEKTKLNKDIAVPIYDKYFAQPVSDSIIALDISSDAVKDIIVGNRGENRVRFLSTYLDDIEMVTKEIALAKTVIIDHVSRFLDSLTIREETNVILLPPNPFPGETFGYNSKIYRSGLKNSLYKTAPLFSSVKTIVSPSEETGEVFRNTINKNAKSVVIGSVITDLLFDERYRQSVLDKLYAQYPQLEGRKIISYLPLENDEIDNSVFYEYLYKDYVLLKNAETTHKESDADYYRDTIVNVSTLLNDYELLAVSDIVIGDFKTEIMSVLPKNVPLLQLCTSPVRLLSDMDTFVDMSQTSPGVIYNNTYDVVKAILDIENYDYTKYNEIKEKYLAMCDGSTTKRLFDFIQK